MQAANFFLKRLAKWPKSPQREKHSDVGRYGLMRVHAQLSGFD
jgi:hypothetical protein